MNSTKAAFLSLLQALSEAELQEQIVEPLLRCMGFTQVRDTSGSIERGKDLIAVKPEFGRPQLYAIQLKKLKISGRHADSNSLTAVLAQLKQAISEPAIDPLTSCRRVPDRCIFITPFPIGNHAFESALGQLSAAQRGQIVLVDGVGLVDEVNKHPEIRSVLVGMGDMELQYRVTVASSANLIHEATAFDQVEALELDHIFVDLVLNHVDEHIMELSRVSRYQAGSLIVPLPEHELSAIRGINNRWGHEQSVRAPPESNTDSVRDEKIMLAKKRGEELHRDDILIAEINLDAVINAFSAEAAQLSDTLNAEKLLALDSGDATKIVERAVALSEDVRLFQRLTFFDQNWPPLSDFHAHSETATRKRETVGRLPGSALPHFKTDLFITGGPGSGKTTLMRRLCQVTARDPDGLLPILVYLLRVDESSIDGLVEACLAEMELQGNVEDPTDFVAGLETGRYRVFFDGLDETGDNAANILKAVVAMSQKFPKVPITVTCRDSFSFKPWKGALGIHLSPFTDKQVGSFVENWFRAEPSSATRVQDWLEVMSKMREAAKTPIIAALLCSLCEANADLPATEIELYERRFELLLGEWESAKRIQPLQKRLRMRYWHFLSEMAYAIHKAKKRSISSTAAMTIAQQFYDKQFHTDPRGLLDDSIQRGLLFRDPRGGLSFGHFTYQEFLVGWFIQKRKLTVFAWAHVMDQWWGKAIDCFAALSGDVSDFLNEGVTVTTGRMASVEGGLIDRIPHNYAETLTRRVDHLVSLAPLTDPKVLKNLYSVIGALEPDRM